jgi:hypothetical protein
LLSPFHRCFKAFKANKEPKGVINPAGYSVVTNLKDKLTERLKEISERFSLLYSFVFLCALMPV